MSVKFTVELDGRWVLKHTADEVLPIDFIRNSMKKLFGDNIEFEKSNFVEVTAIVKSEDVNADEMAGKIKDEFVSNYSVEEDGIITVKSEKLDGNGEEDDTDSISDQLDELLEDLLGYIDEDNPPRSSRGEKIETVEKADTKEEKAPVNAAKECLDKIDSLIGGEEFKKLAHEVYAIAPQIIQNKTFDVFSHQAYIFSINDGYGLSTFLEHFSDLIRETKIKKLEKKPFCVCEEKVGMQTQQNPDPFSDARAELCRTSTDRGRIVCVDIREWMNEINSKTFREFLMFAQKFLYENILVFRVPFVDKEVLNRIQEAVNDVMFVRTVSFPPLTEDEIRRSAKAEIEKYGFKISRNAWEGIDARIIEEKSDGKFYGINTIKKVIRELIYKKQLENATKGKNDMLISKKDALAICRDKNSLELTGYEMLERLVAGKGIKDKVDEIIAQIETARSNKNLQAPCIHMRFLGSPGTGKTTVARIIGKILKEKGVLRVGNFFEYSGRDFCGKYIGETAPKTASICRDAYGSVLFIDEAYSLYKGDGNEKDYGREALDTLIAEMENHRSDLVVIMAGYTDEMETLMKGNAGLASRMPYVIDFPNFTREQLYDIYVSMVEGNFKYEEGFLPFVKEYFLSLPDEILKAKDFSNARFVRNLFERTWAKASMRCQLEKSSQIIITKNDFERSTSDREFKAMMEKKPTKSKIGF